MEQHATAFADNQANWDERAVLHVGPGGYDLQAFRDDPAHLSGVVRFDLPRLGSVEGLDVVHLQCHIGTDTLSLHRLGGRLTGVDLSGQSIAQASALAQQCGADIRYVQANVYDAPQALAGQQFDVVYTGIGALCWLPDIAAWAQVVASLLRPGGRLFVRDGHPVLNAILAEVSWLEQSPLPRATDGPEASQPPHPLALEFPYFQQAESLVFENETSYTGEGTLKATRNHEWNHGLGEIVTAVLAAGLTLTGLDEHDSLPWDGIPGYMVVDDAGEYRLRHRPERLPATFTLRATKPEAQG